MPGSCEYPFFNLWFQATGNRIRVYRVSSRQSIHSTTDRYTETDLRRKREQHLRTEFALFAEDFAVTRIRLF